MFKNKKFGFGIVLIFSMVLVACGRDVSTVENALEGTWTMTDAYVNGEPLVDVLRDSAALFDFDESEITTNEDGEVAYDLDLFYEEGLLTIVDSEGDARQTTYEVLSANEEDDTMRIEFSLEEEGTKIVLQEDITFSGDERENRTSNVNIVDIQLEEDPSNTSSELEQEFEEFGQELVRELVRSIELTLHFDFVSEEAPVEIQE